MNRSEIEKQLRNVAAEDHRRAACPVAFPLTFLYVADRAGLESDDGIRFELADGSSAIIRYDPAATELVLRDVRASTGFAPAFLEHAGVRAVADDAGGYRFTIASDDLADEAAPAKVTMHKRAAGAQTPSQGALTQLGAIDEEEFATGRMFVFDDGATAIVRHDGARLVVSDLTLPPGWEADQLVVRGSTPAMLLPTENAGEFAAALPVTALESGNDLVLVVFGRRSGAAPANARPGWQLRAASASAMTGDIEVVVVATDWRPDEPCQLLVGGPDCDEATIELPPGPGCRRAELPERDAGWRTGAFTLVAGDLRIRGFTIEGEFWVQEPKDVLPTGTTFRFVRDA